MDLAGSCRHFVGGQIDVVSGAGPHASGGGKLIGNRADRGVLDRHGRLQLLGWIMLRRSVHYLCPDWQCQRGAVTVWNDRCRLIESDPDAAGERARVTCEPGVLVIVGGAGLTCRRQPEAE